MMINRPNRSGNSAITSQVKELLSNARDDQIIDLASGRIAIAICPLSTNAVHLDSYFAMDVPNGAAEEYWQEFGPRATLTTLNTHDDGLFELPLGWKDSLKYLIDEDEELAGFNSTIQHLLNLGLATKATEIRRRVLATDLTGVVEDALAEIEARDDER